MPADPNLVPEPPSVTDGTSLPDADALAARPAHARGPFPPKQVAGVLRTVLHAVLLAFEAVERKAAWVLLRRGWPVRVHPFSGFGTGGWALLGGRVLVEAPPRPGSARSSRWAVLRANLLPFLSVEVPGARVRVTLAGREVMAHADREGYVRVRLEDLHLPPGRHQVTLTPVRPAGKPAFGAVHVPDPAADVVVVSDVDDTIVDSGIAHGLSATLRTMLLQEQSTRVPLTGAPELYRALAQGGAGNPRAAVLLPVDEPVEPGRLPAGLPGAAPVSGRAARPDRLGPGR